MEKIFESPLIGEIERLNDNYYKLIINTEIFLSYRPREVKAILDVMILCAIKNGWKVECVENDYGRNKVVKFWRDVHDHS